MICPKCKHEWKDEGRQKGGSVKNKRKGFGTPENLAREMERRKRKKDSK